MSYYSNRYTITPRKLARRLKEGRCTGSGAAYIPWLKVHEVPTTGWSVRMWSEKMQRIIQCLSRGEYIKARSLELSGEVAEFYEQVALLDQERVNAICDAHGYLRPAFGPVKIVMTSDLKIINRDGSIAIRAIKPEEAVEDDERVRQKLLIEQVYWTGFQETGVVDWKWEDPSNNPGLEYNLSLLKAMSTLSKYPHLQQHAAKAVALCREFLLQDACTLGDAAVRLGREFGSHGTGTTLLRFALASGAIPEADFTVQFDIDDQLPLLRHSS